MTIEAEAEAFLAHYGKKGMKWGQRRAAKREARAKEDADIEAARARQRGRSGRLSNAAAATYAATSKKGQAAALAAYEKAEKKFLSHPDAVTAAKITHGEKAANNLALGVALSVFGLAVGATAALAVADSRH